MLDGRTIEPKPISVDKRAMTNPRHQLARIVMDAVVAGSKLGEGDASALARELAAARLRAEDKRSAQKRLAELRRT